MPDASSPLDPSADGARSARLSVRLPAQQKALIERAAALSGLTTTAFVVSTLVDRARAVVLEDRLTDLSASEREAVFAQAYQVVSDSRPKDDPAVSPVPAPPHPDATHASGGPPPA